jgi:hypothetical protein
MMRGKKVLGRRPNGLLFWSFRKKVGKDTKMWTYPVKDFTGDRFRGNLVRTDVMHVTA